MGAKGYTSGTNQFYINNGVVSGPYYANNGKPNYLQSFEYTNKLNIIGGRVGLLVNFALGKEGNFYINKSASHFGREILLMDSPGSYYVYAEYDEGTQQMSFGYSPKKNITHSSVEPESPEVEDYWFDVGENVMKYRIGQEVENGGEITMEYSWQQVNRAVIGWVGVGTDGFVYSMTSFPLHYWFAEQYDEFVNYDGVSFITDGQYYANNMSAIVDNEEIMTNMSLSSVAMNAVVASETAMNAVLASETAMNAVFNSSIAKDAIWDNATASSILMNNTTSRAWMRANKLESYSRIYFSTWGSAGISGKIFVLRGRTKRGDHPASYRTLAGGGSVNLGSSTSWQDRSDRVNNLEVHVGTYSNTIGIDLQYVRMS